MTATDRLFDGPGEVRALCRAFDWTNTTLGAPGGWPASLRTIVGTVLANSFPAVVRWGSGLVQIYNDAYIRFLGAKHPAGLAMSTLECWPESRSTVEPIYERVLAGETVSLTEHRVPLRTAGDAASPEDVFVNICLSPVG
jgi:hypothetical protein